MIYKLLIAVVLLASSAAFAAAGSLDPTFGAGGISQMRIGESNDVAYAVKIQPDGKIVTAGSASGGHFAIARYNTDGTLDPTFARGGLSKEVAGAAAALALQADGKILVAGNGGGNATVVRFNGGGSLDTTFGTQGIAASAFGMQGAGVNAIAIQGDGKIVVAGYGSTSSTNIGLLVARFNSDGSVDASFGSSGATLTPVNSYNEQFHALALQTDGRIVAGGFTTRNAVAGANFVLARYTSSGALDTSFAGSGLIVGTGGGSWDEVRAIAIQSDGKILAGATVSNHFAVARLLADGSSDTTFATTGQVSITFGTSDNLTALAIQPNGSIIAAGYAQSSPYTKFALARINASGGIDGFFGNAGKAMVSLGDSSAFAYAIALQQDGKTIAVGEGRNPVHQTRDFGIARLSASGVLDSFFGSGGTVLTDFYDGAPGSWYAVATKPDGRIVTAGFKTSIGGEFGSFRRFAVGVTLPDGTPDPAFGGIGSVFTHFDGTESVATALAIQPDGKIIAAGRAYNSDANVALARYLANGALDATFGSAGKVVTPMPTFSSAQGVAVQADGKIVVVVQGSPGSLVLRYLGNGALDGFFGSGGIVTLPGDNGNSVVLQPDGKILIASYDITGPGSGYDIRVMRLNSDGAVDTGFGSGGTTLIDVSTSDLEPKMALAPDGRIVLGFWVAVPERRFGVARLDGAGHLDATFGSGGKTYAVTSSSEDLPRAIAVQSDGKILQAGSSYVGSSRKFLVVRYNANGAMDSSFGSGGAVVTPVSGVSSSRDDAAYGIAIQADGKAVAAGTAGGSASMQHTIVRYLLDIGATPPARVRLDINGDGKSDVLFRKSDGSNYVWHVNGASISGGMLAISSQGLLPSVDPSWFVAGVGDFNGDGKADILWRNSSGTNYVWHLDGSTISGGSLTIVSQGLLPSVDSSWSVAGVGDFNGDGKSDIFWRRSDGTNYVWMIDGATISSGVLAISSQGLLPGVPTDWSVAGLGDFNGDGKSDIFWRRSDGTNYVWHVDGATISGGVLSISSQGLLPGVDTSWSVVATGDYNGDGKSDIFFRKDDGTNYVWHVNGAVIAGGMLQIASQGLLPGVDNSWTLVGQGDYNGDGKSDVFWRRSDGANYVWHIDGSVISGGVLSIVSQGLLPSADTSWTVQNPK